MLSFKCLKDPFMNSERDAIKNKQEGLVVGAVFLGGNYQWVIFKWKHWSSRCWVPPHCAVQAGAQGSFLCSVFWVPAEIWVTQSHGWPTFTETQPSHPIRKKKKRAPWKQVLWITKFTDKPVLISQGRITPFLPEKKPIPMFLHWHICKLLLVSSTALISLI